jgi:hypothetical protein
MKLVRGSLATEDPRHRQRARRSASVDGMGIRAPSEKGPSWLPFLLLLILGFAALPFVLTLPFVQCVAVGDRISSPIRRNGSRPQPSRPSAKLIAAMTSRIATNTETDRTCLVFSDTLYLEGEGVRLIHRQDAGHVVQLPVPFAIQVYDPLAGGTDQVRVSPAI